MNLETYFSIANTLSLLSWIILLIFPYNQKVKSGLVGIVIVFLSLLYIFFIGQSLQLDTMESFNSLAGIKSLFKSDVALLAGWIHYLAFDLMVGLYISKNAEKYGIHRILLSISLLLTFMFGPVGLFSYLIFRAIKNKRYFHSY